MNLNMLKTLYITIEAHWRRGTDIDCLDLLCCGGIIKFLIAPSRALKGATLLQNKERLIMRQGLSEDDVLGGEAMI